MTNEEAIELVEYWHTHDIKCSLHEFLGMNKDQYTQWLKGYIDKEGEQPMIKEKRLTLKQLMDMVGKPVWSSKHKEWFLVKDQCTMSDKDGLSVPIADFWQYGIYAYPHVKEEFYGNVRGI